MTDREQTPLEIAGFLILCRPGHEIGVDLRDGRHLSGVFVTWEKRIQGPSIVRLERTYGRPAYTLYGGPRPRGPIVEIPFPEIVGVMIEIVMEDAAVGH